QSLDLQLGRTGRWAVLEPQLFGDGSNGHEIGQHRKLLDGSPCCNQQRWAFSRFWKSHSNIPTNLNPQLLQRMYRSTASLGSLSFCLVVVAARSVAAPHAAQRWAS